MGGIGSGRTRDLVTGCEVLMSDKEFAESVVIKTIEDYNTYLDVLRKIILGIDKDYVFDSKGQALVERPVSPADKVKAIKVWKEMTLDKVISDKKTIAMPENQANLFGDFVDAIQEVERKLDGKIVPTGGGN